jgi:hypothetical protein
MVDASNANDKMRERVEQFAMSAAKYLSNLLNNDNNVSERMPFPPSHW